MAKTFSEINVKAATITGAILGFLCWLLVIPYSYSGYGLMGYMMGYGSNVVTNGTYMMDIFHNYSPLSILVDIVLGVIIGAIIAIIYNWTLKLK